jgi:hypothetical protein
MNKEKVQKLHEITKSVREEEEKLCTFKPEISKRSQKIVDVNISTLNAKHGRTETSKIDR